jgi:broad specificity phosphatase PhoE
VTAARKDTHLLLVRHPETEANINGRFVGRGDSTFTDEGRRQLRRLPAKIAAFRPDAVVSSPLDRAQRLAARGARLAHVPLVIDERLIELDFGLAEGMTFEEIQAAGHDFNYRDREHPVAPGGESRGDVERRAASVCDELTARGGRFVLVTHGGPFRASLVHLLGLGSTDVWAFHIHNAQLAHVVAGDGYGMLEEFVQG